MKNNVLKCVILSGVGALSQRICMCSILLLMWGQIALQKGNNNNLHLGIFFLNPTTEKVL